MPVKNALKVRFEGKDHEFIAVAAGKTEEGDLIYMAINLSPAIIADFGNVIELIYNVGDGKWMDTLADARLVKWTNVVKAAIQLRDRLP